MWEKERILYVFEKIILVISLVIIVLGCFIVWIHRKQPVESVETTAKIGNALVSTKIEYQQERSREEGKYNYRVSFDSPTGAKVHLDTLSDDTLAVTSVVQEDKRTIIVIEPVNSKSAGVPRL